MNRETLLDFFDDRIRSSSDFLVYDNGYRTYSYTYDEIREAATRLARRCPGGPMPWPFRDC